MLNKSTKLCVATSPSSSFPFLDGEGLSFSLESCGGLFSPYFSGPPSTIAHHFFTTKTRNVAITQAGRKSKLQCDSLIFSTFLFKLIISFVHRFTF